MRHRHAAGSALLLIVVLGGACGGRPPVDDTPSPDPPARAEAIHDGVRVSLVLEGPPRSAGLSWADVRIANEGPGIARWAGGGCGDPGGIFIDLSRAFAAGKAWPGVLGRFKALALNGPGGAPASLGYTEESKFGNKLIACPAVLRIERLLPGAVLTMRAGWDGTVQGGPAPTGPARIEAVFPYIGQEGVVANDLTDPDAIRVPIETAVVGAAGGAPVLSPALAVDAALGDPQLAAWIQAAPEASWINPELSIIKGAWHVGLFVSRGQQELYGGLIVDQTGAIVGRQVP